MGFWINILSLNLRSDAKVHPLSPTLVRSALRVTPSDSSRGQCLRYLGCENWLASFVPWAHPSPTTALTALVFWGPWAVSGSQRLRHLGNWRCVLKILPEVVLLTEGRSLRCWWPRGKKGPAPFRGDDLGPSAQGARQQTYCSARLIFVNPNFTNGLLRPRGPSFMEQNLFPPRAPSPLDAGRLPHMGVIKNNPRVISFCCCLFILQSRVSQPDRDLWWFCSTLAGQEPGSQSPGRRPCSFAETAGGTRTL